MCGPQMNAFLVHLNDIHVSFKESARGRRHRVLEGIDVSVQQGQFLAILGPSGCGKSTLLRVMAGLLAPERGALSWPDDPLLGRSLRMAMNFQKPVLLPWLSVEENALLPYRLKPDGNGGAHKRIMARLDDLLDLTGLTGFRLSLPHELSGGMQMRAALVRALITEPDLILMDEPFAAIDEITRQDLGREFRSMMALSKSSTVFVTHSVQEAAFLADRIVIMSPRPSHIVEDIVVRYSCEERYDVLRREKEFLDMCDRLREVMAHG